MKLYYMSNRVDGLLGRSSAAEVQILRSFIGTLAEYYQQYH